LGPPESLILGRSEPDADNTGSLGTFKCCFFFRRRRRNNDLLLDFLLDHFGLFDVLGHFFLAHLSHHFGFRLLGLTASNGTDQKDKNKNRQTN
jgi:hypothetical protein